MGEEMVRASLDDKRAYPLPPETTRKSVIFNFDRDDVFAKAS